MLTVTKELRTETAHRLMDYDGRCSHMHGHSYLWQVTATGPELTPNGMVVDFKDLKRAMNTVLDPLDHALVLRNDDPLIRDDIPPQKLFAATNGKEPRMFLWPINPTAENFAAWAARDIQKLLPEGITVTCIRVWETATSYAEWNCDLSKLVKEGLYSDWEGGPL